MTIEEEVKKVDEAVEKGYLDLVVDLYHPLFERVKNKALEYMKLEWISEIDLNVHIGLVFRQDGKFYNREGQTIGLKDMPRIYQEESNYLNSCADSRSITTPSVHLAMNSAFHNFRERVKKSLTEVI